MADTRAAKLQAYRDFAAQGMTQAETARALNLSAPAVSLFAKRHGIVFARHSSLKSESPAVLAEPGSAPLDHRPTGGAAFPSAQMKSAPEIAVSCALKPVSCKPGQFRLGDPARLLGAAPSRDRRVRLHAPSSHGDST